MNVTSPLAHRISPSGETEITPPEQSVDQFRPRTDHDPFKVQSRGSTGHVRQSELWARQTIHKNSVAAKLRTVGAIDLARGLENCHTEYTFAVCTSCGTTQKFPNRCDRFFCPECQPRLSREREKAVKWWTNEIKQPKHVVLTVANVQHLTKGHVLEFKKWFKKLRHRRFAKHWRGGFYNIEVTNRGNGWHLHLHALIDANYIDSFELSKQWNSVNGGFGRIVKVLDARRTDYLKEVTKYAVKGNMLAAWSGEEILTFINSFCGVKCFGVFGSLYGKRTEWAEFLATLADTGNVCNCGCSEFRYYSELDFLLSDFMETPQAQPMPPPVSDLQIDLI